MGYRIAYQTLKKKPCYKRSSVRLPALILLCFSLFLFLVETLWPEGAAFIQEVVFFPGEAIAVSVLNDLAKELHSGVSPLTAFVDFYRKVLP